MQKPPATTEHETFINKVLRVVAYPVAAISGFFVTANEVHNAVYSKLKDTPGDPYFGEIAKKFKGEYAKNAQEYISGEIDAAARLQDELRIKKQYSEAIGAKLSELGFSDGFFRMKNFTNKWQTVSRGTKQNAVINGLTVAGIAIGAILSTTNSRLFDKDTTDGPSL